MLIRFANPYLSITEFNDIELPELVVLTGVNGSGKTHFLEAILRQSVVVDGINPSSIVNFSYEDFRLENEGSFNAQAIMQEKQNTYSFFEANVKPTLQNWGQMLASELESIKNDAISRNIPSWDLTNYQSLNAYKTNVINFFDQPHIKQQNFSSLLGLVKMYPGESDRLTKDEFFRLYKPFTFKKDFLPQAIGKVIWDYHVRFEENRYNIFKNTNDGTDLPCVTEDVFIAQNGEKPWIVINRILKQFNSLEYEINSPGNQSTFGSYQLRLQNTRNPSLKIDFSNLSSGERILMALVASVYKTISDNNFPDLILLDEIDATLHPSMMKNMIEVVRDVFISRGTKVILVTHSPSTVAFAPENSVFVMNRTGNNRVEKKSKKDALSILTEGFATLEEGMLLFDQIIGGKCSIITEGRNTRLLSKALEYFSVGGVNIVQGIESISGQAQLKTLFEFMCKIPHENKVIFIWDCDVKNKLSASNNTYPIIMSRNQENSIAKSGIENMFPEAAFNGFTKSISPSRGPVVVIFDDARKRDFEEHILSRTEASDFANFRGLINQITRIRDADPKATITPAQQIS